ncbi:MAG: XRE family transcriptional regulator [Planctomycetota bacterium]|nr:MAG: XRE family transcriptional regulator [Planctomycetota bacterium]
MPPPLSIYAREALQLLGAMIRHGRSQRQWSQRELAQRLGVSAPTLQKIERGEPGCHIGSVFEAAVLTGVPLFHSDSEDLRRLARQQQAIMALLPQRIRAPSQEVDDDF